MMATLPGAGPGRLYAVVGPSGAGKDTVINAARPRLGPRGDILFARRVISRPADGVTEDHKPITEDAFAKAEADGAFCVSWRAHGLCYGIPVTVKADVEAGRKVIANGSRGAMGRFVEAFGDRLVIVEITARPEVIAARLASRGRETADDIAKRMQRSVGAWSAEHQPVVIDNSGDLDEAVGAFVRLVAEQT